MDVYKKADEIFEKYFSSILELIDNKEEEKLEELIIEIVKDLYSEIYGGKNFDLQNAFDILNLFDWQSGMYGGYKEYYFRVLILEVIKKAESDFEKARVSSQKSL